MKKEHLLFKDQQSLGEAKELKQRGQCKDFILVDESMTCMTELKMILKLLYSTPWGVYAFTQV